MKIPTEFYKKIVDAVPILCVDVVLTEKDKIILVKRKKEPKKGEWWVPGGRVFKGETAVEGARRKVKEELGIDVKVLKSLGYYEGYFKKNEFGLKDRIHSLSIVFLAEPLSLDIKLDNQGSAWQFSQNLPKTFKIKPFNQKI